MKEKPQKGEAKKHEYLMLDIVKKAFSLAEAFISGNVDIHEPDFVNSDKTHGLEMTWIDNRDRSKKSLTGSIATGNDFEFSDSDAIEWVNKAVEIKAEKNYVANTR